MTYFLNGPMFNLLLFYHFLLYRKKRLLMSNLATILRLKSKLSGKFQHFNTTDRSIKIVKKIVEFSKISIKMKNCKTFCQVQTASHVKEIIQPPPPHLTPYQIKPYYVSGTNIFFRRYKEIYRHLLSKCFKNAVLGRKDMVQYKYFSDSKQKYVCWKFVKSERFLDVLREHIVFNVKWSEVCKTSKVFWSKL